MEQALSPEQRTAIHNAIYAGNKVEAIKLYRLATGRDLRDSKDAVERLADELKAQDPARFRHAQARQGSLAPLAFWLAVAAAIAYFAMSRE